MGSSKKLLLIRHAKSDWGQPGQKDHERPLNEKGRQRCIYRGKFSE